MACRKGRFFPPQILPKEFQNWGVGKLGNIPRWTYVYIYIYTHTHTHTHTYHGSKKAAATLMPAATATTYVTIRLLSIRATKMRNGTAD